MSLRSFRAPRPLLIAALSLLMHLPGTARAQASAPAGNGNPLACSAATDKANALDMRAASAQGQKADTAQIAALVDEAIAQWQLAMDQCEGRARERARRNLGDNQKMRQGLREVQGAGEQCESTQKDAGALQDLARQAVSERRWNDAALLFRKSEGLWDLAGERCTGALQQTAEKRREQAEIDGHNAEFCAPQFDKAREWTQKFRAGATALQPAERQQQSQMAETLWRELIKVCKGSALDVAKANADGLLRERGTPWVATRLPAAAAAPVATAGAKGAATAPAATPAPAVAAAPSPVAQSKAALAAAVSAATPAATAATPSTPPGVPQALDLVVTGGTRLKGLFALDAGGKTYTGNGRIEWANGDVYEGDVLQGLRHGKGEFSWPSGQNYKGDWVQDTPQGQGSMRFANGNLYEGQIENGLPQGRGAMVFASGDIYKGSFSAGQPEGAGIYTWTNGQRCDCLWVKGEAQGRGQLRFANGNEYKGPLRGGQPQGEGEMRYASGDVYTGQFEQGEIEGKGRYQWASGDFYEGQWRAGLKEGRGVMQWTNGDRWEGLYKADAQAEGELLRKKR